MVETSVNVFNPASTSLNQLISLPASTFQCNDNEQSQMHQVPNESIKRTNPMSLIPQTSNPVVQDLLWISKQQQQHPLTHAHPLKNTIRVNSRGIRYKFDGKQWRPLCQSPDGFECRNLAFRSSLCQKHFYKIHLFKRPYSKTNFLPPAIPPISLKRSLLSKYEQQSAEQNESEDDDHSIEIIENNDAIVSKQETGQSQEAFSFFSIDCEPETPVTKEVKSEPSTTACNGLTNRSDSTNTESILSNESESSSVNITTPKISESIHLGIPPLTRTEEKSLANELIHQLSADVVFSVAEQLARRRVCEIVYDNYSHRLLPINISAEWFYDFLLRNPRVPIHFQSWFSSIKATLPSSDQLIDIKIWELGLVTRSVFSSSSISISSSSP